MLKSHCDGGLSQKDYGRGDSASRSIALFRIYEDLRRSRSIGKAR